MISYWKNPEEIYKDGGLVLIIGHYDHKNQHDEGKKALGIHWETYPQSHGILSPCVIPETTRDAILSGLLHKAVANKNEKQMQTLLKGIAFFNE